MLRIDMLLVIVCAVPTLTFRSTGPDEASPADLGAADWSGIQQAYAKASNSEFNDWFGTSIGVSGDTVVVGAPGEDSSATGVDGDQADNSARGSGAAYVFVRSGSTWSQQAYLKASNTGASDHFGTSVAISGDTVVVGAYLEDSSASGVNGDQASNVAVESGAAYVFVRSGTTWSQQAYLKASNTGARDLFGYSVSVSGDTVVVGAEEEDSAATGVNGNQNDSAFGSGAAYVFVRDGTTWSQNAYVKASNTQSADNFGESVAVSDDLLIVGAPWEDSGSAGVNGNSNDNSVPSSGAAYVFERSGELWLQAAYLKASNPGIGDLFGQSVALSGETVVVGAHGEDSSATGVNGDPSNNSTSDSGAAYVFERNGGAWQQEAYLKASNTGFGARFGLSVATSADHVVVGAPYDPVGTPFGAAYIFVRNGDWSELAFFRGSNTGDLDFFGYSVGMSAGIAVVGAYGEDSGANGVNGNQGGNGAEDAGAAYFFRVPVQALVAFRNAGSNPVSYLASPITIGSTFTATVDNNLPAQLFSLLFAFDSATSFPLNGGQVLLCIDQASGEIFTGQVLAPTSSAGGVDSYSVAVPNDPALAGFTLFSQAIQFGNPPFVLSNAQDVTVGG